MSSGTPYIGSKISLISKAKIRYEGFLYTIDQNESTVTLAKVKSLGTEDRCPNDPVPKRDEIFEYIVFRGHDIDDLHVSEAPKQQQISDPAIAHSGPVQQTQNFPSHPNQFPYGQFGGMPNMGGYPQFPPALQQDPMGSRQTPPTLPRTPTPEAKSSQHDDRSQTQQGRSRTDSNRSGDRKNSNDNRNKGPERYENQNRYNNRDTRNYRDNRDSDKRDNRERREHRDNRYNNRDSHNNRDNHREQRKDDRENKGDLIKNERNVSNERRRGGGNRGRGNRGASKNTRGNTREKFTEDFDFETSNAKFHKEEIEKELLKVLNKVKISDDDDQPTKEVEETVEEKEQDDSGPLPSPDQFYDRSKSFFDNISCEAMGPKAAPQQPKPEETGGVITRRQERALNVETFGSTAGYYRHRGGYRGRGGQGRGRGRGRGRGNHRGRGNFHRGNSNRSWVDYEFDYEAAGIKSQNQQPKAKAAT